ARNSGSTAPLASEPRFTRLEAASQREIELAAVFVAESLTSRRTGSEVDLRLTDGLRRPGAEDLGGLRALRRPGRHLVPHRAARLEHPGLSGPLRPQPARADRSARARPRDPHRPRQPAGADGGEL